MLLIYSCALSSDRPGVVHTDEEEVVCPLLMTICQSMTFLALEKALHCFRTVQVALLMLMNAAACLATEWFNCQQRRNC